MPGGSTIHVLRGLIEGNASGLSRAINTGISATRKLGRAWGTAAKDVGSAATRITAAVGVVGGLATRTFARFEETMVRVGGVTRTLGTRDFARLENAAKQAGETTRFTAIESAEAMEKLGLAGLETTEIIEALPKSLQLASAAQVSIAQSAEISAKTMRAFRLEATELDRVNDVLIGGFTNSNLTLEQLFEGLSKVGSVATSVGEDLEDVTAILGIMADNGIDASTAGVALRNAFIRLAAPTSKGKKLIKEFGLDTSKPMIEILKDLEVQLKAVGDEQEQLAIVTELFGIRGGPQLLTVLNSGADSAQTLSDKIRALRGISGELEAASLDTISGQFDILRSVIEGVVLAAGQNLMPTIRELIAELQAFVTENRADIVREFGNALQFVADTGVRVVTYLRDQGPALAAAAGKWLELLTPILRFIAERPRLLSMLVLLKGAQMLGVIQAVTSLGSAFLQTGVFAVKMMRQVGGLRSLGLAAVVGAIVLAFRAWNKELSDNLNRSLERTIRLANEAAKLQRELSAQAGQRAQEIEDPAERKRFLQEQLEAARASAEAKASAARGDEERANELASRGGFRQGAVDFAGGLVGLQSEADNARQIADASKQASLAAAERVKELERLLAETEAATSDSLAQIPEAGKAAGDAVADRLVDTSPETGGAIGEEAAGKIQDQRDAIADALADAQSEALDKQASGTSELRDLLMNPELTQRDLLQFGGAQEGFDDSTTRALLRLFEERRAQGPLGAEDATAIALAIQQTAAENRQRVEDEQTRSDRGESARSDFGTFKDNTLGDMPFEARFEAQARMESEFNKLADQLSSGAITVAQFDMRFAELKDTTLDLVAAEQRELQEKERKRLLEGKFTQAEFQKAVQDRIIAVQQQRFAETVDEAANKMLGLDEATDRLTDSFDDARDSVGGFQRASGQQAAQAFSAITGFLNSRRGQIAAIQANIALMTQNLQLLASTGSAPYRQTRAIKEAIESMHAELARLLQEPAPVFSGISGDPLFRDPGLQTPQVTINQNNEFPNVTRLTNSDIARIYDAFEDEARRRGRNF